MSDVTLSQAVRANLLSLKNTATMMSSTQNTLATGKKVNSALDNPSNFFTASSLNARAGDMNALMDGMANGIQTLEAADNGLKSITKTLESMQSTLRQARQDKSFETKSFSMGDIDPNAADLGKLTLEGGSIGNLTEVDLTKTGSGQTAMATDAFEAPADEAKATYVGKATVADADADAALAFTFEYDGVEVSVNLAEDGDRDSAAKLADAINAEIQKTELADRVSIAEDGGVFTLSAANNEDGEFAVTAGAGATTLFGDPEDADEANQPESTAGSDGKYEFTVNGKEVSIASDDDLEAAVGAINTALGEDSKFEAYEAVGGKMAIRATSDDAGSLAIAGADADLFGEPSEAGVVAGTDTTGLNFARNVDEMVSAINTDLGENVRASNDNGKLRIENLSTQKLTVGGIDSGGTTLDGSDTTSEIGGNKIREDLAKQYNELRDQLDKLADDASFNGINLLRGDNLQITFNETGTSELNIQSKGGETINSANLDIETQLEASQLDSDEAIDGFLNQVKTAVNSVRAQSSAFGSSLSVVQNRQDFTENMMNTLETGAGNLTLADSNEEAANLLALQTRQQLSSTALSMASQQDQAVLRLF